MMRRKLEFYSESGAVNAEEHMMSLSLHIFAAPS